MTRGALEGGEARRCGGSARGFGLFGSAARRTGDAIELPAITAQGIAQSLGGRGEGKGWRCLCPAHDRRPSLFVCEKDGKSLVKCWSGCTQFEAIKALRDRGLAEARKRCDASARARPSEGAGEAMSGLDARQIARGLGCTAGPDSGGNFLCRCPGPLHEHGDRNPSLSIKDGRNGRLLLHCFAGCAYDEIVAGLRARGLHV